MARQRIHNSRAGHSSNTGASWISYSDMMAALLLVFVLILCVSLYQYYQMLDTKTRELDEQKALVTVQQSALDEQTLRLAAQQVQLDEQNARVIIIQTELDAKAQELENTRIILVDKEAELNEAYDALADREDELIILQSELANQEIELNALMAVLNNQQLQLDAQQAALAEQTQKIDDLVGMRTQIIQDLSAALTANNLRATVDSETGDIVLDSAVLFQTNSYTIMADGKALLDRFIPVYLSVLLQPEYSEYLGEIIIEGHTDTDGDYINNLELSQNRALNVAKYVLNMPSLTPAQRSVLQQILTATGRSESIPVYNYDGTVNKDASRRVEFKFSLKDAEMIEEMNRLLQQQ